MTTATLAPGRHRKATSPVFPRVFRVVTNVVLGIVALVAVTSAVLVVVLHIGFAPVLSPSMEPGYAPGDLMVTRTIPVGELTTGDIAVLPRPDAPGQRYAHRVIELTTRDGQPVVRTKGDANTSADPQRLRIVSSTVPVAIGKIPVAGRLALYSRHLWLRLALIILIGLCVLVAAKRLLWDRAR